MARVIVASIALAANVAKLRASDRWPI